MLFSRNSNRVLPTGIGDRILFFVFKENISKQYGNVTVTNKGYIILLLTIIKGGEHL